MDRIELKEFVVGDGDLVTIVELSDEPGTVVFVAEKIEDGVSQRRGVKFPLDPALMSHLAQQCMRIGDIQQISISKRKNEANIQFGPTYAKEMLRRSLG